MKLKVCAIINGCYMCIFNAFRYVGATPEEPALCMMLPIQTGQPQSLDFGSDRLIPKECPLPDVDNVPTKTTLDRLIGVGWSI